MAVKVKVKFLDGKEGYIYPVEKYRLIKKGRLKISDKEQKEYDALFAAEPKIEKPKKLGRTQYDTLNKRIDSLEDEILDIKIKQEKFTPETKEKKSKPETKDK